MREIQSSVRFNQHMLKEFCRRNHVVRLALFGSVLRDDFSPQSDVDVLVEFEGEAVVTFPDMARMEAELAELFGRTVDLRTPQELSRYFRDHVVATAVVQYAA